MGPHAEPHRIRREALENSELELSLLKGVQRQDDGSIMITVDRLTYYTGAEAIAYYAEHPELTPSEHAVVNQNPRMYTFGLASRTPVLLGPVLGSTPQPAPSDAADLVSGFERARAAGQPVHVWLQHDGTDGGWVTYLAEQVG